MTYLEDICLALVRVFDRAVFYRDARIAGYAANARFWAAEVRHVLDCLAGYESRYQALKAARLKKATESGEELDPKWLEQTLTASDLSKLRNRLVSVSTRFFRLCRPFIEIDEANEIELLLGITIGDGLGPID